MYMWDSTTCTCGAALHVHVKQLRMPGNKPLLYEAKPHQYFHTHTPVMIRAFPETGFIVFAVHCAIGTDTPIPFTILPVYEILPDKIPAGNGLLQSLLIIEILEKVHIANHCLSLYPPMTVGIYPVSIGILFINHPSFRSKPFRSCYRYLFHNRFYLCQQVLSPSSSAAS